jgi:S-formylglutathione hydrolase FrmB
VKRTFWLAFGLLVVAPLSPAQAHDLIIRGRRELEAVNRRLHGQIVDYTHNHGADRRIWSDALGQKRDVYVYLPPRFDAAKRYPLIIALHGYAQDERAFLKYAVDDYDQAMASGCLPPAIMVVPDGSVDGDGCRTNSGSFFLNSKAGRFEDFVMQDVWDFAMKNYPIRPEREAHVLLGVSMGGGAAFNLGIKYRDRVQVVAGIFPPVNTRYVDCHGRYMSHFDPDCQGLRTDVSRGHEVVGRFYGVVLIPLKRLLDPIYDRKDPSVIDQLSRDNPFEMLDAYNVKEGELSMFIAYAGRDEFNIDAQVESFLYKTKQKGLTVDVAYDPKGRHDYHTVVKLQPSLFDWLSKRLAGYGPSAE